MNDAASRVPDRKRPRQLDLGSGSCSGMVLAGSPLEGAERLRRAIAADYHTEQRLHRAALGRVTGVLPGNVPPPPDLFRPTFGRFKRRLDEIAAGL